MTQLGLNLSNITTVRLLFHVQNYEQIGSSFYIFLHYELISCMLSKDQQQKYTVSNVNGSPALRDKAEINSFYHLEKIKPKIKLCNMIYYDDI